MIKEYQVGWQGGFERLVLTIEPQPMSWWLFSSEWGLQCCLMRIVLVCDEDYDPVWWTLWQRREWRLRWEWVLQQYVQWLSSKALWLCSPVMWIIFKINFVWKSSFFTLDMDLMLDLRSCWVGSFLISNACWFCFVGGSEATQSWSKMSNKRAAPLHKGCWHTAKVYHYHIFLFSDMPLWTCICHVSLYKWKIDIDDFMASSGQKIFLTVARYICQIFSESINSPQCKQSWPHQHSSPFLLPASYFLYF